MKKFKFKNSYSKHKNTTLFILFIIFIILFILLSNIKLDKSNLKIINYLLKDISPTENTNLLTSNLNNMLVTHYFKHDNIITDNNHKPLLFLYNKGDISLDLKSNLEKLGMEVILEDSDKINEYNNIDYFIDIDYSNKNDTTTINSKKYAKITFLLDLNNPNADKNKSLLLKMHNYLEEKYSGISMGIINEEKSYNKNNIIHLKIGGTNNNYNEVNNSTEIVSLMLYHVLYDNNEQIF